MKVHIGPYIRWCGPYQIAEKIMFWRKDGEHGRDDRVHNFGTWLAEDRYGNDSWLTSLCQWIYSKRKRKVFVKIDRYDTWNMDYTLAVIIHPMLIQFRADLMSMPEVELEDLPENLRDADQLVRWEWVLDEMIWAFGQIKIENESEYLEYDKEKEDVRNARMKNGFRLFGKYYTSLWD